MVRRTKHQWKKELRDWRRRHDQWGFELGDMFLEIERQHGESAYQIVSDAGVAEKTVHICQTIARRFPPETRDINVPFQFYRDAGSDLAIAESLIAAASRNGWSRSQFRAARKELEARVGKETRDERVGRSPDHVQEEPQGDGDPRL